MNTRLCGVSVLITFCSGLLRSNRRFRCEEEPHHHVVLKNDSVMVLRAKLAAGREHPVPHSLHDRFAVDLSNATITQQKLGEPVGAPEATKPGDVRDVGVEWALHAHHVHNDGNGVFEVLDVELLASAGDRFGSSRRRRWKRRIRARGFISGRWRRELRRRCIRTSAPT